MGNEEENENELYITDLVDADVLQRIQDAFSRMTGMASLTTDADGKPVTKGTNFTDFCMKYTRGSKVGCVRCQQCDKFGAETTMGSGHAATYYCHAGLIDFSAPIVANGKLVGCFIGGQVLSEQPNEARFAQVAEEIGVDPEEYLAALRKVNVLEEEDIERSAEFLYNISNILSDIAYGKHLAYEAGKEMERAAKMKSDFLANMSHEIRTPMNAVIGMAEMALREELPPAAREYINQIKASGRALLTIINDILDFSKIESGKMDIHVVEYEPMSLINDVVNIVMTRLQGKDVELILDVTPGIPNQLLGDNIRIKQILINIANNAIKFTNEGEVVIRIGYENLSEDKIELRVAIEDTGIGIKKQDLGKLFQSFQQVDSKRNRNIEGTGLGLAVSKRLLSLMGGDIRVESEYGKGSKFSFVLPQTVIDAKPSIAVTDPEHIIGAGLVANDYIRDQIKADSKALGVEYVELHSESEVFALSAEKELFLFIERELFSIELEEFVKQNPWINAVVIIDFSQVIEYNIPNLLVVKKPIYALNLAHIYNKESVHFDYSSTEDDDFDFVAPEAEILVVDDNAINLTIVEGLLEPLNMKIVTALSGKEAISKISVHHYDMIFMDHMMPELDGVETTHIIRRFHEEYNDTPIIALTANAVDGTKEMFLQEGMNDFVAKPIELRMLVSKVKQWLPIEKVQRVYKKAQEKNAPAEGAAVVVGDLDTRSAIKLLGSEALFWNILRDYYRVIERKADLIMELKEKEDWAGYTIEVHALKSSSRQIGAMELAEQAAELEKAGNARDTELLRERTDAMLERYRGYISVLEPFFKEEEKEEKERKAVSAEVLHGFFADMRDAIENLDMDRMEEVIRDMDEYGYNDWQKELYERLKEAVEDIDVDACETIIADWESRG